MVLYNGPMALSSRLDLNVEPLLRMTLDSLARENNTNVSVLVRVIIADWLTSHDNADVPRKLIAWTGPQGDQEIAYDGSPAELPGVGSRGGERQ